MGGCAGKNKKKSLKSKGQDNHNESKTSPRLEENNNVSNDHHSAEQTTIEQFNETNQVIGQIFSSAILSISDSELEFELANLIYGNPERDYAENPSIAKTFRSTEVSMMTRLLLHRRSSMSSIEEEDESELSDELVTQIERRTFSQSPQDKQPDSTCVLQWDSEFDEQIIQSMNRTSQTHPTAITNCSSPFSLQLYEEDDVGELDAILNELEEYSSLQALTMKSSSLFSPDNCVSELRTLEDQLQAALASLTLTINDCSISNSHSPIEEQHSSDSSGLGDELGSESYPLTNTSKTTADDCDSAFSESGSTEKTILSHPEASFIYRPLINPIEETSLIIVDHDQRFFTRSEHPSKILIRTYNDDGSTKSIFIDDTMFIRDVLFLLIQKNHREPDVNYALIEILPDLHMERIFEDHQKLTEAILMWPTISSNRLGFSKRVEKYNYLRTMNSYEQFFSTPNIEGNIYFKEKSRKSWKKYFCVLRSSGLYFIPKGKSRKDLICLANLENVELFFGLDWKRKFKSPSDFCFALKHPLIQKKSSKYIKYMCVESKQEFDRWIRNIRIAKFGQQLKINCIMMDQAMKVYGSSGRFADQTEKHSDEEMVEYRRTPIPSNQYYSIHSNGEDSTENSPIKSASYMDELRQQLERVLSNPLPITKELTPRPVTMIPPPLPKFKSSYVNSTENLHLMKKPHGIKSSMTIGSTPLPRKQMESYGNFSYRTINPLTRRPSQSMNRSFIIPSKEQDDHNGSLLSMTSNLDETNLLPPPPSSTFLSNSSKRRMNSHIPLITSKQTSLPLIKPIASFRTNPKSVPPVPPRKSSIPRPILKPQPPQRNSSTHIFLRQSHLNPI